MPVPVLRTIADAQSYLEEISRYHKCTSLFLRAVSEGVPRRGKIGNYRTNEQMYNRMQQSCEETGIPMSRVMEINSWSETAIMNTTRLAAKMIGVTR